MSAITQVFDQVKDDAQDFANWMTSQAENLTLRNSDIVKTRHWLASQLNDPAAHYLKTESDLRFATTDQGVKADSALQDATAFATAAQGVLAEGALKLSDATAILVPTMLNGWSGGGGTSLDGFVYSNNSYYKTADGTVVIHIISINGDWGLDLFVVPIGFRPKFTRPVAPIGGGNGFTNGGWIEVLPDGRVVPRNLQESWVTTTIIFKAGQ